MAIYQRGKTWYYEVRVGGKKIRHAVGTRKLDASAAMEKAREAIRLGRFPELRRVKPILFSDHATEVLAQHYSKKRSEPWASLVIKTHLIPYFGRYYLGQIDAMLISRYMTARLAGSLNSEHGGRPGNGSVNNERALLSKVMSLAVTWERIASNAVKKVPKLEAPKGRERVLSHDEADALIAAAPRHLKPILICALETGGRRAEVLGLKWTDVDFSRAVLWFTWETTKSAKTREVPITPLLAATLRSLPRSIDPNGYVFRRFGRPLKDIRTAFTRARIAAGLDDSVDGLHVMRHTFCTWYGEQPGASPFILQQIAGHADMKTTMGYFHGTSSGRRSAVALMGRDGGPKAGEPTKSPQSSDAAGGSGGSGSRKMS